MIGFDLVEVKPLSQPSGQLVYMDFAYGDKTLEYRRKKIDKILERIKWKNTLK